MSNCDEAQEPDPVGRLEALWAGEFGDAYTLRNEDLVDGRRQPFWNSILEATDARSVLEVGCNIGANLRCLADGVRRVEGVDVNVEALRRLKEDVPYATGRVAQARSLPFDDCDLGQVRGDCEDCGRWMNDVPQRRRRADWRAVRPSQRYAHRQPPFATL